MGGSNGGLLMGAMLTQRPELFRAVVIQVPLLDMLRFHKLLAGASWIAEYGDPDRPEEAAFLRAISPYHNLRPGMAYPEPFFVTSTKDDRVHPGACPQDGGEDGGDGPRRSSITRISTAATRPPPISRSAPGATPSNSPTCRKS